MQIIIDADVYVLSESARKAIHDHARNQICFLAQIKREAQTPELVAGIQAEIEYFEDQLNYYAEPKQIFALEAPSL